MIIPALNMPNSNIMAKIMADREGTKTFLYDTLPARTGLNIANCSAASLAPSIELFIKNHKGVFSLAVIGILVLVAFIGYGCYYLCLGGNFGDNFASGNLEETHPHPQDIELNDTYTIRRASQGLHNADFEETENNGVSTIPKRIASSSTIQATSALTMIAYDHDRTLQFRPSITTVTLSLTPRMDILLVRTSSGMRIKVTKLTIEVTRKVVTRTYTTVTRVTRSVFKTYFWHITFVSEDETGIFSIEDGDIGNVSGSERSLVYLSCNSDSAGFGDDLSSLNGVDGLSIYLSFSSGIFGLGECAFDDNVDAESELVRFVGINNFRIGNIRRYWTI